VVKSAKIDSDKSAFMETEREVDTFCEEDVLKQLRVGNTLMPKHIREKLEVEPHNIKTVGQLKECFHLKPQRWQVFVRSAKGVGEERFLTFFRHAFVCSEGKPKVIDHRKANNPCLLKCGVPLWSKKVKEDPAMKAFTCVRDLVTHTVAVGKERRKGPQHADDWHFYHNALSLMTSNKRKD